MATPNGRPSIHHVAFMVRPENFEATTERMAKLLNLKFEGPYDLADLGTKVVVDYGAGIEFITVTDPTIATAQAAFLEERGEGFYRLVFGVDDLESSLDRAAEDGIGILYRYDGLTVDPEWKNRFSKIDEAILEDPSPGVRICLGQFDEHPTTSN
ncbi:VOC family protein [Nocardia carnea]|uniref:VOC family protein n=1 Tax=Nocardia carnea TaxID=37328 RepID=UPI0024545DC3|nr:VOC family protein [Nocardia carnea]